MPETAAKTALLDDLRRRIERLERPLAPQGAARPALPLVLPLGVAEVDRHLPGGGLPAAALHEIAPVRNAGTKSGTAPNRPAALGFAAGLLGRAAASGPVLWCRDMGRAGNRLHAPGLESFGLHAGNLIIVNGSNPRQLLWAMEESLRSGAVTAVLAEISDLRPVAARRLQLAAEAGGALALLIGDGADDALPAATRWRIATTASPHAEGPWPGPARWSVTLHRCRHAPAGAAALGPPRWFLEWRDDSHDDNNNRQDGDQRTARGFRLAAALRDGSPRPAQGGGREMRPRLPAAATG